jgi:hypothetical protein
MPFLRPFLEQGPGQNRTKGAECRESGYSSLKSTISTFEPHKNSTAVGNGELNFSTDFPERMSEIDTSS